MSESFEVKKFLFDLAFDDEAGLGSRGPEKPKPTFTQEQLDAAQKEAFDNGFAAGKTAAMESQQQFANILLTEMNARLSALQKNAADTWARQLAQLQRIALVIAKKIMPIYVSRHGLDEIENIIGRTIGEVSREPRLVIRVAEAQFDDASARINALSENQAYAGKIVILGDPDLGPSDCRIEWADGGIERDVGSLWQEIDRVMDEVQSAEPSNDAATADASPSSSAVTGENL